MEFCNKATKFYINEDKIPYKKAKIQISNLSRVPKPLLYRYSNQEFKMIDFFERFTERLLKIAFHL